MDSLSSVTHTVMDLWKKLDLQGTDTLTQLTFIELDIFVHPIGCLLFFTPNYTFCVPNWVHDSYTQLGTNTLHPLGYKYFAPNWVFELCTQLGTYIKNILEQGICLRKPNLEHRLCTQLGTQGLHPIGYNNSIPGGFLRLVVILHPGRAS